MKRSLIFVLILFYGLTTMNAQQPYAGCWHPDFIRDWTPEKDPDRKFNKSSVPLQPRIATATTQKAHSQQFADGQVAACLTMHPMCSQVPSQGANNFVGYNPTYWQYLDLLVWWGGSAGEGIILPPSAPVIDAAHLSGVKVLGQIFFPTTTHSGLPAWVTQMNTQEGGIFPYARKCAEIAKYYGFDGWFINSETVTSTNWGEWVADYLAYSKQIGLDGQEIQIYVMSSGTSGARIEDVASQKGGSYMADYGGITTSNVNTRMDSHVSNGWGDKADAFHSWYYGVEQSGAVTGNGSQFKTLFPTGGHIGSINFFNPEEPIWKKAVEGILNGPNSQGAQAYAAMNTAFQRESQFWVNSSADVTSTNRGNTNTMPGLATAIQERSAIQSKPFITTFSAGLGKHRFVNGEKKGTQDWYHRGMQTVMPTWRWWQTEGALGATGDLKFNYNWDDAYNIGTSINVSGNLKNNTDYNLRLYKTKLVVASGDIIKLVYKTNKAGSVTVKIADSSNDLLLQALGAPASTTNNGWTIDTYDLTSLAGKTIVTLALGINAGDGGSGYTAQLGQLGVYPANYNPAGAQVSNLAVENQLGETTGDLRVVWDKPASDDIHHFNVYLERNGVKTLVGQTRNEGFYIPKFARNGQNERSVKVSVTAVDKNMNETPTTNYREVSFPDIQLPVVSLKASKTLVAVGEEITVTAKATNFPEEYTWNVSDGVVLVRSTGNTAVYKFEREGKFSISVDVRNAVGTATCVENNMVNVSSEALQIVSRASAGGKIKDVSSYMTASNEAPSWLIDETTVPGSVNQKWCAGGSKEHWVILELDQPYELYRFQIYDCGNKENASDNLTNYRIYTSMTGDADDWKLVLDEKEVPADEAHNTKDDYIKPTLGRYVKFVPYDPEKAITIRIWQFDVWGFAVPMPPIIGSLSASKPLIQPNEEVTFTVSASGSPTNYEWTVEGGTPVSQNGNQAVYKFAGTGFYNVTVTATNVHGTSDPRTFRKAVEVSRAVVKGRYPLALTGFNADLIAENLPAASFASPIDSQGWSFYTSGAAANGAIPANDQRIVTSAESTPFQFAAYDGNNALLLKTPYSQADLTLTKPVAADTLRLLATSANGEGAIYAIVLYEDGNNEMKSFSISDWCGSSVGTALGTIGRIKLDAKDGYAPNHTDVQCRMFEFKIPTDPAKKIASLSFMKMSMTALPAIFAATADATVVYMTMEQPQDIALKEDALQTVETTFTLNMEKDSNFGVVVTADDNTLVNISDVVIGEDGTISFNVEGLKAGEANIHIRLVNGEVDLTKTFKATVNAVTPASLAEVAGFSMQENTPRSMEVAFSLGERTEKANFDITVTSAVESVASVSNKAIDKENGKVTFDLTALTQGASEITITLVNGTVNIERRFTVTVDPSGIAAVAVAAIEVAPNPVKAGQMVSVKAERATKIRLVSLQGTTLFQQTANTSETQIATAGLRPGVYLIQVTREEGLFVSKLIVQ